jgi:hypothetical protein
MLGMLGPQLLADPYRFYERLHGMGSVIFVPGLFGIGAWVVGSYGSCQLVLRGKSFGKEGAKVVPAEVLARIPQESVELAERRRNSMLFRDPPDHTRLRSLVNQAFTPRTIEQLRPHIAEIADQLIDAMTGTRDGAAGGQGSADLIGEFAFPLPITVIAELLGVPPADRDRFKAWSTALAGGLHPAATPEDIRRAGQAAAAIDAYVLTVVEERRREPRPDLISALVQVQSEGDKLSEAELAATCRLILTAGHETTVNLIGNGMRALLLHPEAREALTKEPALLPSAIEELLRYDSPVQMTVRFCYQDTALGPHHIKRGDLVITLLGAANRDPAQFPDPDRLDLRRENAHTHLSFGLGIHYCLGASLARVEGELALSALLRRLPSLSLTKEPLIYRDNLVLRGLKSLPVAF